MENLEKNLLYKNILEDERSGKKAIGRENYNIEPIFEPVFRNSYKEGYQLGICFCICDCGCDKLVLAPASFTMTTPIDLLDSG